MNPIEIILQNDINANIPSQVQFEHWIHLTLKEVSNHVPEEASELCIRIVDEEESAFLNETYRGKSGATNILSFSYNTEEKLENESLGDLVICADIVKQEIASQNKTSQAHWAHLTIHGVLHLLGYDHEEEKEAHEMEKIEIKIMQQLGYDNPYEEK